MTKRRVVIVVVTLMVLVLGGVVAFQLLAGKELTAPEGIDIQVRQNVRVVCDIASGEDQDGVSVGLRGLARLADTYDRLGVDESQRHIHGVFHGPAGTFLLDGGPYAKAHPGHETNPNAKLVDDLVDRGVHVELGAETMHAAGAGSGDLLDGVDLVVGAEPRVVDLQLSGYAYVRF